MKPCQSTKDLSCPAPRHRPKTSQQHSGQSFLTQGMEASDTLLMRTTSIHRAAAGWSQMSWAVRMSPIRTWRRTREGRGCPKHTRLTTVVVREGIRRDRRIKRSKCMSKWYRMIRALRRIKLLKFKGRLEGVSRKRRKDILLFRLKASHRLARGARFLKSGSQITRVKGQLEEALWIRWNRVYMGRQISKAFKSHRWSKMSPLNHQGPTILSRVRSSRERFIH